MYNAFKQLKLQKWQEGNTRGNLFPILSLGYPVNLSTDNRLLSGFCVYLYS